MSSIRPNQAWSDITTNLNSERKKDITYKADTISSSNIYPIINTFRVVATIKGIQRSQHVTITRTELLDSEFHGHRANV